VSGGRATATAGRFRVAVENGTKSKRQDGGGAADPGRKLDGRVQQRMERTLGAITSKV